MFKYIIKIIYYYHSRENSHSIFLLLCNHDVYIQKRVYEKQIERHSTGVLEL